MSIVPRRSRMPPSTASDRPDDDTVEARRLLALARARILDTPPEPDFDDLVVLASQLFDAPIALVSLVDRDRQWFKAKVGLAADETDRSLAFCAHAIETPDEILVVDDATRDARFADNPLVTGDPHIRFYAGAPIVTGDGSALGTVCVIDRKAGRLDPVKAQCLRALARQAAVLIELRTQASRAVHDALALLERNEALEQDIDASIHERDRLWALTDDLLATIGPDDRLERASPSWSRALGRDPASLAGPLVDLVHDDERDAMTAALAQARGAAQPAHVECRLATADGDWRWIDWSLVAAVEPGRIDAAGRDVTDLRARDAALSATEAALRQAQKMEALGQLTGGLAHDFNNLLTGITGSLELLKLRIGQGRTGELDRYLDVAQGAAKRAAALTHRLLAFARRQTLDPRPTNVARLVEGMVEIIRRTVGPEIDVAVVRDDAPWPAMVDANQLENVLLNLCINARDAMPDGGRLTIATSNRMLPAPRSDDDDPLPAGAYLALAVSDTGTGMTEEVVKRAFDPFFTTKPLGVGTGLGLSMVYGFARQSGGEVRIDSTPGRGTTMTLLLPRHAGGTEAGDDVPTTTLPTGRGHDETVLIVDDERSVRMLVREVLDDLGYRSLEAHDGASGLRILQSDATIDLLVTDVGLPGGLNGRQVADAARALRPELKVLFITGYAEQAAIAGGALGPGMAILTKPFTLDALARRVADLLQPEETR